MLRVSLTGPGNIDHHFSKLLNIPTNKFEKHVNEIAKVLADSGNEIIFLLDRGVAFEIAKKYKEFNGRKVFGAVPKQDKDFGIKHLQPYITIVDEIIDTDNWYKQDMINAILGDVVLMLGNSLGSLREITAGFYLYKLFQGEKPKVDVTNKRIHKDAVAGDNIPFTLLIYKPFFKKKLNYEIEVYIKKSKGQIFYIKNARHLKKILELLSA